VAIALVPRLLQESRAPFSRRHFDIAGAASITAGLMLLVYALTRATTDGWTAPATVALLGGAAGLVAVFLALELRSPSPLLPLRIFRLPALAAANATMALSGAVTFSEFFVLTLYLQDVLRYSAVETGTAFSGFALAVVIASNIAQAFVRRVGVRATLTAGLILSVTSVAILTRLPVRADYLQDLLPAFVLGGAGLGLTYVAVTIAGLAGVKRSDAGVASGLINTSRQIGGAIGLAATSTIAATSTSHYVHSHPGLGPSSALALDHGFQSTLYVLTGLLLLATLIAVALLRPASTVEAEPETGHRTDEPAPLEQAA
jgi:hypothetical protein